MKDCRNAIYLTTYAETHSKYASLIPIAEELIARAEGPEQLEHFFGPKFRLAMDEVIDMPRTGRYSLEQLEPTEKTYIGTKVEIVLRDALKLERGEKLDARINGREVDIKNTTRTTWMIPTEALGEVCLLVQSSDEKGTFSVGLIECTQENVTDSWNKDQKRSVSGNGKKNILWLVKDGQMPGNVFRNMDEETRTRIFNAGSAQWRLVELFRSLTGVVIQRYTVESVAQQLDYMKRLRRNGGAQDVLDQEGLEILWGGRKEDNQLVVNAGYPALSRDEFICLPKADIGL